MFSLDAASLGSASLGAESLDATSLGPASLGPASLASDSLATDLPATPSFAASSHADASGAAPSEAVPNGALKGASAGRPVGSRSAFEPPVSLPSAAPAAIEGTDPKAAPVFDRRHPETLHPALWRGHQLGRHGGQGLASGFAELDAQLPGGGWPRRALSELLLAHPGVGEIRLLAPALAAVQQAGRVVMLFDPPAALSGWALADMGLDVERLLLIQAATQVPVDVSGRPGGPLRPVEVQARLWALEQALKSGHVGAVLAWLPPRLSPDRVRRLQLAAQAHDGPAFVLREAAAQGQPSASPLRLGLRAAGVDQLAISVFKRRGPPLLQPLHLRLPAMLSPVAARRAAAAAVAGHGGASRASTSNASGGHAAASSEGVGSAAGTVAAAGGQGAPRLSSATFINLA